MAVFVSVGVFFSFFFFSFSCHLAFYLPAAPFSVCPGGKGQEDIARKKTPSYLYKLKILLGHNNNGRRLGGIVGWISNYRRVSAEWFISAYGTGFDESLYK